MNTTRLGKIARLPRFIRQQLNTRLEDGMTGEKLLEWINGLPETQAMLAEEFDGKAINKQNLSDWRQGGHQDWVRAREDCELAASLAERAQELGEAAERPSLSDGLAMLLTLHLARQVRAWQFEPGEPKERWRQLREMLRELALLRREDSRAERTEIARQKWHKEAEATAEAKQEKLVDAAVEEIAWRKVVGQMGAKSKSRPVLGSSPATEGGSSKSEARPRPPKGRKPKPNPPRKNGSHGTRSRKPKESPAKGKSHENSQLSETQTPASKDEKGARQPNEPETPAPGTPNPEAISKRAAAAGKNKKDEGPHPSDSENRNPEPEKTEDIDDDGAGQEAEPEAAQSQSGPVKPSQAFELSDSSKSAEGET